MAISCKKLLIKMEGCYLYFWLFICACSIYSVTVTPLLLGFLSHTPRVFVILDGVASIFIVIHSIVYSGLVYVHLPVNHPHSNSCFLNYYLCHGVVCHVRTLLDLAGCFPWELFQSFSPAFRFVTLLRLLRLFYVGDLVNKMLEHMYDGVLPYIRMLKFVVWGVYWCHCVGCLFYFLARVADKKENTWLWYVHPDFESLNRMTLYMTSFYFALHIIATLGFGDISPKTSMERGCVVGVMILTALLVARQYGMFENKPTSKRMMLTLADFKRMMEKPEAETKKEDDMV